MCKKALFSVLLACTMFFSGCGNQAREFDASAEIVDPVQTQVENDTGTQDSPQEEISEGSGNTIRISQTGITQPVPDGYLEAAEQQGNVVRIEYDSLDYVRDNAPVTKTAYVYLPYGYDENDEIKPVIAVSPTFYNDNSDRSFGGSDGELREFHQDFANHLMPAVEGQFHTYAQSVDQEDVIASRDHRAFAGFSLGSVTT